MINRVEYVHAKNSIHRGINIRRRIKPDNFSIGWRKKLNQVHTIGFDLAKKYRDPKCSSTFLTERAEHDGHRTIRKGQHTRGHRAEQERRLGGAGYVLMYLNRGSLPW